MIFSEHVHFEIERFHAYAVITQCIICLHLQYCTLDIELM